MRLTAQLRRLREDRGHTIDEVAADVGISKSTLSRIETGQVAIKLPVLQVLLQHYGLTVEDQRQIEQLNREANQRGWWQDGTELTRDTARIVVGLEAEASSIKDVSIFVLYGMLQTEAYAAAVLRGILYDATSRQIDDFVQFRMRRKQRFGELQFWTVISEECLRRPVGGRAVMRQQIRHLYELATESRIVLQVLGLEAGQHPGLAGPFTIISIDCEGDELNVVHVEANGWDSLVEERDRVRHYQRDFDRLRAAARSPEQSLTLLAELEREYGGD
jgi:transcriptional regulator with XRE-family HTH domain